MNTPKPCDTCVHLYYDAFSKDDPSYMAECKKGHDLEKNCLDYKYYKKNITLERIPIMNEDIKNELLNKLESEWINEFRSGKLPDKIYALISELEQEWWKQISLHKKDENMKEYKNYYFKATFEEGPIYTPGIPLPDPLKQPYHFIDCKIHPRLWSICLLAYADSFFRNTYIGGGRGF